MNTPRTKEVRMTASPMWDDWELATAGLKGTAKVPKRTLKRWEKEVAAWHDENDGKETA